MNAAVVDATVPLLQCPSDGQPQRVTIAGAAFGEIALTDYFAVTGANATSYAHAFGTAAGDLSGVFGPQTPESATVAMGRRLTQVTDGLSNTAMISEMSGRPWPFITGNHRITSTSDPSYPAYLPANPATDTSGAIVAFSNGTGGWAHNNNFNISTWSADGRRKAPARAPSTVATIAASTVFTSAAPIRRSATAPSASCRRRCPSRRSWRS